VLQHWLSCLSSRNDGPSIGTYIQEKYARSLEFPMWSGIREVGPSTTSSWGWEGEGERGGRWRGDTRIWCHKQVSRVESHKKSLADIVDVCSPGPEKKLDFLRKRRACYLCSATKTHIHYKKTKEDKRKI